MFGLEFGVRHLERIIAYHSISVVDGLQKHGPIRRTTGNGISRIFLEWNDDATDEEILRNFFVQERPPRMHCVVVIINGKKSDRTIGKGHYTIPNV
jgi:hypothetical protein